MQQIVVGLLGRAGSGKDSVAAYLGDRYGATNRSFAAPLKRMAKSIWDLSDEQLYGTQADKEQIDPRHNTNSRNLMQRLGAAARDHLGPDVWIDACLKSIWDEVSATPSALKIYTISDVRHLNEAAAIKRFRAPNVLIKLVCEDAPLPSNPDHPSEREVDEVSTGLIDFEVRWRRSPRTNGLIEQVDAGLRKNVWVADLMKRLTSAI
jgi:hypothetical protein